MTQAPRRGWDVLSAVLVALAAATMITAVGALIAQRWAILAAALVVFTLWWTLALAARRRR